MKLLAMTILCCLMVSPIFGKTYVGVSLGTNDMRVTNQESGNPKIGYKGSIGLGTTFSNGFRTEGVVSYSKNDNKTNYNKNLDGSISNKQYHSYHYWSAMANVIYDVTQVKVKEVVPYVGVGAGYCKNTEKAKVKTFEKTTVSNSRDGRFAYQAIIGASCPIDELYSVSLEYNYFCGRSHAKDHAVNMYLQKSF